MEKIITLDKSNIAKEHICCAISDKKCKDSYELKKDWLKKEIALGSYQAGHHGESPKCSHSGNHFQFIL